jgi:hypothetical protein
VRAVYSNVELPKEDLGCLMVPDLESETFSGYGVAVVVKEVAKDYY